MEYLRKDYSIKDLAKECGVSIATASKALNGYPNISEKTREKVLKTADKHGYIPNSAAKTLKQTVSRNILLLLNDLSHPFVNMIILEFTDVMKRAGYELVVRYINGADPIWAALNGIKENRADGIVILGTALSGREREITKFGIPVILYTMNMDLSALPNVSSFHINDVMESYHITKFLQRRGARDIAFITTEKEGNSVGGLRTMGYRMAMEEAGMEVNPNHIVVVRDSHFKSGYEGMEQLLQNREKVSAVLCSSDRMAMGCCRALFDWNRRVPEDVMVAGFDGSEITDYMIPTITTVKQPRRKMFRDSAEHLLERIVNHAETCYRCYNCKIIEKETTDIQKWQRRNVRS